MRPPPCAPHRERRPLSLPPRGGKPDLRSAAETHFRFGRGSARSVHLRNPVSEYSCPGTVSYTHLDVYKRQVFEDDALEWIAEQAMKKETGARALRSIIEDFMLDIMYEIPKDPEIGSVVITVSYTHLIAVIQ